MKPRCGINPISYGWLLGKYFILSKGNFKQNKALKNLAVGYGNLSNGHQPIRTRQISLRWNNTIYQAIVVKSIQFRFIDVAPSSPPPPPYDR